MKTLFVTTAFFFMLLVETGWGQQKQWDGNNNTTDAINRRGNVGIGTLGPRNTLEIMADIGATGLQNGSVNHILISGATDTTENLLIGFETENDYAYIQTLDRYVEWGAYDLALQPKRGNVGIGTTTPGSKLYVSGGEGDILSVDRGNASVKFAIGYTDASADMYLGTITSHKLRFRTGNQDRMAIDANGNVGIGTTNPYNKFDVMGDIGAMSGGSLRLYRPDNGSYAVMKVNQNQTLEILTSGSEGQLNIDSNGNVGIGTTSPVSKLEVKDGDIRVTNGSFIDDTVTMKDYVFEDDYSLMSLDELRRFISREKHLPNVPNAEDVKKQGLNISEFQMLLLEKVEELTLYTLAQQKKIEELETRLNEKR